MVTYALYAERWGWHPEQVDRLTIQQDDWLMPIARAFDGEKERQRKRAEEKAKRDQKAKANVTGF